MSRSFVETLLGAVVVLVALGFVAYAYAISDIRNPPGYLLTAKFDRIDGIGVGSDVRISGIKVGEVISQGLDTRTFRAEITFSVRRDVELPFDSSVAVVSESLLGGRFLLIQPGADEELLAEGDEVMFTQSAINIEDLIGRFVFSGSGGS